MRDIATIVSRWRVRLGYVVAIVALWLARPSPRSVALGAVIGLIGLWLRAYAAGYLRKQEVLTVTGPYAHTRNPLYLGSFILAAGAAVAMRSWLTAAILLLYFGVVYTVVMRGEETELRQQHGTAFEEYARAVPVFFPRFTAAQLGSGKAGSFSFAQYCRNREYRAAIGYLLLLAVLLSIWRLRLP